MSQCPGSPLDSGPQQDLSNQFLEVQAPGPVTFSGSSSRSPVVAPNHVPDADNASPEMGDVDWLLDALGPSCIPVATEEPSPYSDSGHDTALHTSTQQHHSPFTPPTAPVPRIVNDYNTILVECYFKDTAPILALYDGNMNPFRSTVSRLWGSSELLYLTLQSMSAAFLSNVYPPMSQVGVNFRQKAIDMVQSLDQANVDEGVLIAIFMIGGTASWFDADDIGLTQFTLLRQHVQRLIASGKISSSGESHKFFRELLTCWEMFLAFVADDDQLGITQTPTM